MGGCCILPECYKRSTCSLFLSHCFTLRGRVLFSAYKNQIFFDFFCSVNMSVVNYEEKFSRWEFNTWPLNYIPRMCLSLNQLEEQGCLQWKIQFIPQNKSNVLGPYLDMDTSTEMHKGNTYQHTTQPKVYRPLVSRGPHWEKYKVV